jgi:internalin A
MDHSVCWWRPLAGVVLALFLSTAARGEEGEAAAALQKLGGVPIRAGLDSTRPVVKVEFNRPAFTDAGLKAAIAHLKGLPSLRALTLGFTGVTDAGLADLAVLADLEDLGLAQTAVTDAGLAHLKHLKKLRTLDLEWTKVTDNGVRDLQKSLPDLKVTRRPGADK